MNFLEKHPLYEGSSAYFFGFAFFQLIGYQNNRYRVSKRGQAIEADLGTRPNASLLEHTSSTSASFRSPFISDTKPKNL
mgnify:CR=1 FL=1